MLCGILQNIIVLQYFLLMSNDNAWLRYRLATRWATCCDCCGEVYQAPTSTTVPGYMSFGELQRQRRAREDTLPEVRHWG